MPTSKVSKVLIQKEGSEGHYISEFYLKYESPSSSKNDKLVCHDLCTPIKTDIKAADPRPKVHSFTLKNAFTAKTVRLYAKAEKDKPVAGRFDLVVEPVDVKMKKKFFPKVVSMFRDRADQIKSIKINSAANEDFNKRFDLDSANGFGAANLGQSFRIDIELKTPQQVAGIVFRQPNDKKKFTNPTRVMVLYKNKANTQW